MKQKYYIIKLLLKIWFWEYYVLVIIVYHGYSLAKDSKYKTCTRYGCFL